MPYLTNVILGMKDKVWKMLVIIILSRDSPFGIKWLTFGVFWGEHKWERESKFGR